MSFVGDGNFVCAHLKSKGAGQDMFLKQGQGYFVHPQRYANFIANTIEDYDVSHYLAFFELTLILTG
jgi:hypothetical protein